MNASLDNALVAVRDDPVRRAAESAERHASRRLWRAMFVSPSIPVCEALIRGEQVPVEALDPVAVRRLGRRSSGRTIRVDDLGSIPASSVDEERVDLGAFDPGRAA